MPHEAWDDHYDFIYEITFGDLYQKLTRQNLEAVTRHLPSGRIIDYGAGTGRLAIPFRQAGYEVIAVEPGPNMAECAVRKIQAANLDIPVRVCTMAEHGPEAPADMAICLFTVMSYVTEEAEMKASLRNIADHLKQGGLLLFDLPDAVFFNMGVVINKNTPMPRRYVTVRPIAPPLFGYSERTSGSYNGVHFEVNDDFHLRQWTWPEMNAMLAAVGLTPQPASFPELGWTGATYRLYRKG